MLQLVERGFFKSPVIKLSGAIKTDQTFGVTGGPSALNPAVQVLRVGKFNHPKYGEFEITRAVLQEMKDNFDNRVRGVDIAFDYFHESDKEASGWPTQLFLKEDDTELWADVDWTPKALAKLSERELRYFSPDFAFKWTDPETNKTYNNVLFGGGLTNRPFVKDMAAIVASEDKGDQMKLDELEKLVVKLAEDNKAQMSEYEKMKGEHADMKAKLAEYAEKEKVVAPAAPAPAAAPAAPVAPNDAPAEEDDVPSLKKKLAEAMAMNEKLMGEKKVAEESKKMAEKVAAFNVLLTEGKACVAQKDAFLKDDMTSFIKLAQPLNLAPNGSAGHADTSKGDREDRVLKLAEEKCKADPKLDKVVAISLAQKEIK